MIMNQSDFFFDDLQIRKPDYFLNSAGVVGQKQLVGYYFS